MHFPFKEKDSPFPRGDEQMTKKKIALPPSKEKGKNKMAVSPKILLFECTLYCTVPIPYYFKNVGVWVITANMRDHTGQRALTQKVSPGKVPHFGVFRSFSFSR